jgi:hypothetical protein
MNALLKNKFKLPALFGVLMLAAYFFHFSSLQFSDKNGDWGAFGSYLGGVSTFVALIFAMLSVKEWREEKLFSVHLSLVDKLARVFFDATTYVEYEKCINGELERGSDASEDQNNQLKYRRKLTESYSNIFCDHMVLMSSEKKDYPSILQVLGILHNTISFPSEKTLTDLGEKINVAIEELNGGKINKDSGREIATLYTDAKHFIRLDE